MLVVNEQVTLDDLHYVAFCDFTKLGTFNQQSLNHHAQWMQSVLVKNPLRILAEVSFIA